MRRGAHPQFRDQAALTAQRRAERRDGKPVAAHAAIGGPPNHAVAQLRNGGAPLHPYLRAEMEARFGESFADVRVHDDPGAHGSARSLGAKAYTLGDDIVFGAERYAPHGAEGKRLIAHELAHVVQQRRGGAPPPLSADAPHERGAAAAAAQVMAGAPSVHVGGATAVGVARDADDAGPLPEDAARILQPGPEYWLSHAPKIDGMPAVQLYDERNQVNEWLFRQTQTTPDVLRMEQVRDQLQAEVEAREKKAGRAANARSAAPKAAKASKPKQVKAASAEMPAARPGDAGTLPLPRILREHSSVVSTDPAVLEREYNEMFAYLQHGDASASDRAVLQTELENLKPALARHLIRRSADRHGEVIGRALTPTVTSGDQHDQLLESVRRIDSIRPLDGAPGYNFLMDGHEMVVLTDEQVDAIRQNTLQTLDRMAPNIPEANNEVQVEYHEFVDKTFDDHPIVGAISMVRSGENPLDWDEKLMPIVQASNIAKGKFDILRRASKDPWNAGRVELLPMAEHLAHGERLAERARTYLEYKTGLVYEGTAGAIGYLQHVKQVGQIASNIAFTPGGAALYAASESFLEQASEIHYGQRDSFDVTGIVFDAAANYAGSKVTGGIAGLAGKSAPAWMRAAAFVAGDRAGAAVSTGTRLSLDRAAGRSDASASDILGASFDEATNWKQALLDIAVVGGHKVVHAYSGSSSRGRMPAEPTGQKPVSTKARRQAFKKAVAAETAAEKQQTRAGTFDEKLQTATASAQAKAERAQQQQTRAEQRAKQYEQKKATAEAKKTSPQKTRDKAQTQADNAKKRMERAREDAEYAKGVAERAKAKVEKARQNAEDVRAKAEKAQQKATAARSRADALQPPPDPGTIFDPSDPAFAPAPDAPLASNKEPIVWTRTGKGKARGTYVPEGSKRFGKGEGTAKPQSWAEAEGFRPAGSKAEPTPIQPRKIGGRQVESSGAGGRKGAKFISATAREQSAVDTTSIRPDLAESGAYNHNLEQGEVGMLRPQGSNAKGVDSITAAIEYDSRGRPVKARIYLNDPTTPNASKAPKESHGEWRKTLDESLKGLEFNDPALEKVIQQAAKRGDVFVRIQRVEATQAGKFSVRTDPRETWRVEPPARTPQLWNRVPHVGQHDKDKEQDE